MARALPLADYLALKGTDLGTSDWILVDQARIDQFAETTGDHQFIHVNPELAKKTPFGTTIAHGYLTLSLLSAMAYDVLPGLQGAKMGVNYGLNSVRFLAPVKSGKRVRGQFTMKDVSERSPGVLQAIVEVKVEIEGEDKPALAAEWVTLTYI
ncbi:MaoC family dehydratase [Sandaracinobacter neustonicus]|uniref:MaoC family dehydratase n=1 Tax=Sandaracinobacter neustonicus TaxID=1715348 RepID=A0A501XTB7_9SPHN|nr:MaoC family dehydratase [Sandaracinobacter neustonicus]TPE63679.1 MaoC family dehydratase [Sandaracinobacter neustonicus]